MPTFQYISDLHLEFYDEKINKILNKFDIIAKADYLILAGDIGNPFRPSYRIFLENVATKFKKVFVITGNHEYYGNEIQKTDNECRFICLEIKNVIFLQDEMFSISEDLKIIGTTLWSNIPNENKREISECISDYRLINNFTTEKCNLLHRDAKILIEKYIKDSKEDTKFIIITHHMPSMSLISSKYKNYSNINYSFASDLEEITNNKKIIAWVYGHTHEPYQKGIYYCNPIGYPGENPYYNINRTFEISEKGI